MNRPHDVIIALEATDSKLVKQEIIAREAKAGNDELFRGFRMAYDSLITFGVKKVAESTVDGPGLSFNEFGHVARQLANRELTGDAAQAEINALRKQATINEWNYWYRRILIKDMKAGFGEKIVNSVCKKDYPLYAIPVFECQLAKDCVDEDGNVDEQHMTGVKQIDCKLDGTRCLNIIYPNGQVVQFSRNGIEWLNFGEIKRQLSTVANTFAVPMVLDSEVMSANFQDLMKQARRKSNVQASDAVLNVFDMLPLDEFLAGMSKKVQRQRSKELAAWYETVKDQLPNVNVLGYEEVDLDTAAGQQRLAEINKLALAGKYEGIMLKDPEAPYECKRSYNWLKMKPFIEETLVAVDIEEGKADGNFVGMMGAIVFEGVVDDKPVKVHCGGGFSIQQRAQIWADFTNKPVAWKKKVKGKWQTIIEQPSGSNCIGMLGEVRADCLTKSENSDTWSMRFPRFKVWRGFAKGEKL